MVSGPSEELRTQTFARLSHLDRDVLVGRAWILSRIIFDVCAEYEAGIAVGDREPNWAGLGNFLTDAATGILAAPVSDPSPFHPDPHATLRSDCPNRYEGATEFSGSRGSGTSVDSPRPTATAGFRRPESHPPP